MTADVRRLRLVSRVAVLSGPIMKTRPARSPTGDYARHGGPPTQAFKHARPDAWLRLFSVLSTMFMDKHGKFLLKTMGGKHRSLRFLKFVRRVVRRFPVHTSTTATTGKAGGDTRRDVCVFIKAALHEIRTTILPCLTCVTTADLQSPGNRRRSNRVRAPLPTPVSTTTNEASPTKRKVRRGGRNKHRAGQRMNRTKTERLRLKHMNVGYWNCSSAKQRGPILDRLVYDYDILMLQETKVEKLRYAGFQCYANPVSKSHHGQAILVRQDIAHSLLDLHEWDKEDRELQGIQVTVGGKTWNIVNLYAGNDAMLTPESWDFLNELEELPGDFLLVCGDFNARGTSWGNTIDNRQGRALESALLGNSMTVLNLEKMTRLATREPDSDSNIDLALVSAGGEIVTRWQVLTHSESDHLPCAVMLLKSQDAQKPKCQHPFRYSHKEDSVLGHLRQAAWGKRPAKAVPRVKPPWWSQDIEVAWTDKRRKMNEWQQLRVQETASEIAKQAAIKNMKQATKHFKQLAAKYKMQRWQQFTKEVSSDKTLTKFWQLHKSMNNINTGKVSSATIKDEAGQMLTSDGQKGSAFFQRYITQTDQGDPGAREALISDFTAVIRQEEYPAAIKVEEVRATIKRTADSSPGPDGVRYSHMKELGDDALEKMAQSFNSSLRTGEVPEEWLHSYLMPLPKPGKDIRELRGFRIITLQNTYGKVMEKIVAGRIARHLEDKKLLPSTVGAYRPGRDSTCNAYIMACDIYEGFQKKKETAVLALDLEDAYNRVNYTRLIDALMDYELDPWIVRWVASVLKSRQVALRFGTWTSETRVIVPGLPQGSPLSPVLFNIYTAEIARLQLAGPGRMLTFADDIEAYIQGTDRDVMARQLQDAANQVLNWCHQNNAVINPEKAQVLWCSLDNRIVNGDVPAIACNGVDVGRRPDLRYLGITFDRCLCFAKHIDNVVARARKGLAALRVMAGADMPQRLLFAMMQSLVLSSFDYGLGMLTLSKTQVDRMDTVQNEAMRTVLGCTRDTPIIAMRYLLDLPSVSVRHKVAQVKAYMRVAADVDHPLHRALDDAKGSRLLRGSSWMAEAETTLKRVCELNEIGRGKEWAEVPTERRAWTRVVIQLGRECREWTGGRTEFAVQEMIESSSGPGDVVIFTDGSVQRGSRSGWGFMAQQHGRTVAEGSGACAATTSSMRMEVEAATAALTWLATQTSPRALIVTDSQSMLRKIENGQLRSEWVKILEPSAIEGITWIYCPGHAGVRGNERADWLAGMATVSDFRIARDKDEIVGAVLERLQEEEEVDWEYSRHIERIREIGVQKGAGRKSSRIGKERRTHNQKLTGTISRATLQWLLGQGTKHDWECPECHDVGS